MKIKILSILACAALLTGCGNKFLNSPEPHDGKYSPETLYAEASGVNMVITGMMAELKGEYNPAGQQNSRGVRGFWLHAEYMGQDVMADPSLGWFFRDQKWEPSESDVNSGIWNDAAWYLFYNVINQANNVIYQMDDARRSASITKAQADAFVAESKAIRGFCYFQLARVFAKPYNATGGSTPGLPIYKEPATDANKAAKRSTLGEVYAFILEDLNASVAVITPAKNTDKKRAKGSVPMAWRAMVKLEMGDYAGAEEDGLAALAPYGATVGATLMNKANYLSGFNSITLPEVMWGFQINSDQSYLYQSIWNGMDYRYTGCTFYVNTGLLDLYAETDYRGECFGQFEGPVGPRSFVQTKMLAKAKTGFNGDYIMMRTSEIVLLVAEAQAHQPSKQVEAQATLFALQSARDADAVESGNTGDELVMEVVTERRKELYGEIGTQFFDYKRLGWTIERSGNYDPATGIMTIPPTHVAWVYQIPRQEFESNSLMNKDTDQNKR